MLIEILGKLLTVLLAVKGGKGRVPDVRVPDVLETFPGLLSFLLLLLIGMLIVFLINLSLGLEAAVTRNKCLSGLCIFRVRYISP